MPLESVTGMLDRAVTGGYAVAYFENWSIDSLQGVIDAAEQSRSPIIIGFNGEYMSRAGRVTKERLSLYGALGVAAAESASVPCGLIFNECAQDDWVKNAVGAGFNLVMPADPDADFDDYLRRVTELTRFAHDHNVAVEAELGELPCGLSDATEAEASLTDPETAAQFVEKTGIDMLAVSVGNVHVMLHGQQGLNLEHLSALRKKVSIPLVLHGGSGIDDETLRQAVTMGIAKVNYGTYVKQHYLAALREALNNDNQDPHKLLGYGGDEDLLVVGRCAVRDAVLERIGLLGCCGKA